MLVVTLPPSAETSPESFAREAKRAGASLLEVRGDVTPSVKPFASPLPLIVSPRGRALDLSAASYVDLELHELSTRAMLPQGCKLILSHHEYAVTPTLPRLKRIAKNLLSEKPWAVKIATFVETYNDLQRLAAFQRWLSTLTDRSIVLAMGPKASLSRILSLQSNTLTYAALWPDEPSAPGQLPLSFYAYLVGRRNPAVYGILGGSQVSASLSPLIHNLLFQRHGIDAVYASFPAERCASTLTTLAAIGVRGVSVTAPFKRDAFAIASTREREVSMLGVANTLLRRGQGWAAMNTDWIGVQDGYPILRKAKSVAILGAGGAVPSVILAVKKSNPRALMTVYARDPEKAKRDLGRAKIPVLTMSEARRTTADVVICAVSQDVTLSFPSPASPTSVAIDLRYDKRTKFLVAAAKAGYRTENGIPMLVFQALRQFTHFTGKRPKNDDAAILLKLLSSFSHGK